MVVLWYPQGIDSRSPHGYQNPGMLNWQQSSEQSALYPRLGSPQIQRASCTQEDTAALWPTKSPSLLRNPGGRLQMCTLVTISAFSLWLIKKYIVLISQSTRHFLVSLDFLFCFIFPCVGDVAN